jgi:hypothetical protein
MLGVVQVRERPLVQTVAFISLLLAVVMSALPAFVKNLRASRFAEPLDGLSYIAARATLLAAGRPVDTAYPPSAPLTPGVVPRGELVVDPPGTWDHPTWRLLDFKTDAPHAFAFEFQSENGPEGATFSATARGDLDGDGNTSTFILGGDYQKDGSPRTRPLALHREVE